MGLLKFHFAFSILCLITFLGFRHMFRVALGKESEKESEKEDKFSGYLMFFVPVMNVLLILVLLYEGANKFQEKLNGENERKNE